ncbi:MAG TPA: hypothetical protein VK617_15435 [Gemmatimonadaceae bacterium]|nr:hypothetical protein [Gemmatimonadaceae bacterium]
MNTGGGASPVLGVEISANVALMIAAVMLVGIFAAVEVSPLLALPTLIVTLLLGREARRAAMAGSASLESSELPPALRATVDRTLEQLPDGDARRLLSDALVQARPVLAPHAPALDERQERATRDNICSLVDACCTTALELTRLDVASSVRDRGSSSEDANRIAAARELLVGRLSRAATALSSLYVAGVEHGSPASDLVAQLADEINADARARRAAASEMSALLGDGEQTPSS